jgi:hypothetical protein
MGGGGGGGGGRRHWKLTHTTYKHAYGNTYKKYCGTNKNTCGGEWQRTIPPEAPAEYEIVWYLAIQFLGTWYCDPLGPVEWSDTPAGCD